MIRIVMALVGAGVGGGLGAVTLVGVVNSQTAPPDQSITSVDNPTLDYGSSN